MNNFIIFKNYFMHLNFFCTSYLYIIWRLSQNSHLLPRIISITFSFLFSLSWCNPCSDSYPIQDPIVNGTPSTPIFRRPPSKEASGFLCRHLTPLSSWSSRSVIPLCSLSFPALMLFSLPCINILVGVTWLICLG